MSEPEDLWRTKDGKVAIYRLVYHAADLETASYPAGYAQRNPRFAPLTSPPGYPLQVLASDGELHGSGPGAHQRRRRVSAARSAAGLRAASRPSPSFIQERTFGKT